MKIRVAFLWHHAARLILAGLVLLVTFAGCASQSEVDALKKEIESMKTQRTQHQQALQKDIDKAQTDLDQCKLDAAANFDARWKANSTPRPSKDDPTMRTGSRELLNHLYEEQHRANADCQRDYENALQKAKLLHGATD